MRTVYRNGVVHARGPVPPTTLVVEDERIVWLGADTDTTAAADAVVDLDGALVTPGFVDAHAHVVETGLAVTSVDLSRARSLREALEALEGAARGGGVVVAHGWDETVWPERRAPSGEELARAVGGLPAYALRVDLRSAVVSAALADATGCRAAPGWADGVVTGQAHALARTALRPADPVRRAELARAGLAVFARHGVVSVHEHSTPELDTRSGLAELLALTADAAAGLPEVVGYRAELCEDADDARRLAAEIPGLAGVGAVPVDGSIGARAAALRAPYADREPPSTGDLVLTAEQVANHVGAATRAGVQAVLGVVGDRAMAEALLGVQAAADVEGVEAIRAARHRLEHAEMVDTPAMARILLLGLTISGQPLVDELWGGPGDAYERRLGAVRAADLNPFADLVGAGVTVAFGSASPVTPVGPWAAIRAAVHHHEPSQRLSMAAAFHAHTAAGHEAARRAGRGELRVGAAATFAVWRADGLAPAGARGATTGASAGAPPLPDLAEAGVWPRCLRTVRDGVVLYDETD